MPLPDNFSPWEHLQDVLMQVHNKLVREEFSDLQDDDNISTPRGSLKVACTLRDDDSALMTVARYLLFYLDIGKARDLQVPIYGMPITTFQEIRKFRPQIHLFFKEKREDVDVGYDPVLGTIGFRLMDESAETITMSEVTRYANKIKTLFATGNGLEWKKGRYMCAYNERDKGYQLQLLCRSETEGRRMVERVLQIQDDTPKWKYLTVSENADPTTAHPAIPPSTTILGKRHRLPRSRPVADVHFQHAILYVWGSKKPIVLVDRAGTYHNPVVEV